jgi:hypothetical protein
MPPSGANPPVAARTTTGAVVELLPLAREICGRYRAEFPDEGERYGHAGEAWCLHDNQYLLAWAIDDARDGSVDLVEQALWLRDVLDHRGFPVDRLARNLEIAGGVVAEVMVENHFARAVADRLADGAAAVRAGPPPEARSRDGL